MRVLFLNLFYPLLALSSFINPFYGVLNYAFISVIRPESLTWGGSQVKSVSFMAIACLLLASVIKGSIRLATLRKGFFISFGLFYLFLLFATVQSPITYITESHHILSMSFMNQILIMFVYCLCLYSIIKHDQNRVFIYINTLMLMFLFMALWGINQRLSGNILIEGLFGHAIIDRCAITGVFVLIFPLGLYNYNYPYEGKWFWKYCGLFSSLLFAVMVFFTESRAGFLGFMLCVGVLCVSMKHKIRNLIILSVCLIILFPMLPDNYKNRISSIGKAKEGTEEIDHSAGSRIVMWRSALNIIIDHPLLGVGNLNFAEEAYNRRNFFLGKISQSLFDRCFQENFKLVCHNTFLDIIAEGGLLTAIPFYTLMFIPIISAIRMRNIGNNPGNKEVYRLNRLLFYLLSGILGYLVTCIFANMKFIDYYYWVLTLILTVSEILKQKVDDMAMTR